MNSIEYLNLYDKEGNLLQEKGIRGQKTDKLEGIAIIFIENTKKEFLIQKASSKRGGVYATTGGHVKYGATFLNTIIDEVKEELGIDILKNEIKEIYSYIYDKYFQKVYYLKKNINLKEIIVQKDEVDFVKWLTKEEIDNLIDNNQFRKGNIEGYKYIVDKSKK